MDFKEKLQTRIRKLVDEEQEIMNTGRADGNYGVYLLKNEINLLSAVLRDYEESEKSQFKFKQDGLQIFYDCTQEPFEQQFGTFLKENILQSLICKEFEKQLKEIEKYFNELFRIDVTISVVKKAKKDSDKKGDWVEIDGKLSAHSINSHTIKSSVIKESD